MANRLISPSLADVSQDIAGVIPADVIIKWNTTKKNKHNHSDLLSRYTVTGTVVSSDSVGLTKLTGNKSLVEVMKLINDPKEVLFQYGKAIGGKEIGIWEADNTQMFYEEKIEPQDVIKQMIGAQKEIDGLPVHLGLGVHYGNFLSIGGGLFGDEADFVEELAENYTVGGEIALSAPIMKKLSKDLKKNSVQKNLSHFKTKCFSLNYSDLSIKTEKSRDYNYPYAFPKDFFRFVRKYKAGNDLSTFNKYSHEKIVIFVKVVHKEEKYLLDELSDWILANMVMQQLSLLDKIELIKSNGNLGIFMTNDVTQAIAFALDVRDTLAANGYLVNIGIAKGEVLIFRLKNGLIMTGGGPVNVGAKLAEDSGMEGQILVESSVDLKKQLTPIMEPFKMQISRVDLTGYKF